MRIVSYKKISNNDRKLLILAKKNAGRSVSDKGHKVGCIILCSDKSKYLGATVARTRSIGSTCAERMALDQYYFDNTRAKPVSCYLVGSLNRESWNEKLICTPCGVCLEMFLEILIAKKLKKIRFVCGSWDLTRVLIANLSDLFPQLGKGGWPYNKNIGKR